MGERSLPLWAFAGRAYSHACRSHETRTHPGTDSDVTGNHDTEQAREGSLLGGGFDPRQVPDEVTRDGREWILSGNYIRVAQTIYAEKIFPQYGPVLLIHGDQDEAVPFHYSVEAEKAYQNAELVRIPGDTHCYDHHLEMVTDTIRAWMPRVL